MSRTCDALSEKQEIATTPPPTTGTALVNYGTDDPFAAYADAVSPHTIIGKLLKFSKGDYTAGEENEEVAEGTQFTANVDELQIGWVHWRDGKPVDTMMRRLADRPRLPKRHELGSNDEAEWEVGGDGKPKNPWQFTNHLLLMDENGDLYTFATSSRGGVNAVADLCRVYSRTRKKYPDDHLVVTLQVGSYQHSNKEFGKIKFPKFTIAGREPKTKFNEALLAAGITPSEPAALDPEVPPDPMNDQIPF